MSFLLPQQMTAPHVTALQEALLCEAQSDQPVQLDAHNVEFLGAAGAQLLLALGKHLEISGRGYEVTRPSEAFIQHLRVLGLESHIPLTKEQGSHD